ncbi:CHAT domain-containing protein [Candidatus Albibeggiatoa sp. nov. NOAA]|uniref:CHAT domain-containing protein n=1 Tax=Candidatus Albibeggiatoa sp. nov. NOAA TaxID=3162724 RepID=UPI0032FFDC2E|nr:CHAT domain-containing protein [Thiotrichaceae bacterium]
MKLLHLFIFIISLYWLNVGQAVASEQDETVGSCSMALQEKRLIENLDLEQSEEQILIEQATRLQAQGYYAASIKVLRYLVGTKADNLSSEQKILLHSRLGDAYLAIQQLDNAQTEIEISLELAQQTQHPSLLAHVYNNLGNFHGVKKQYDLAQDAYDQAITLAREQQDETLYSQALANKVRAYIKQKAIPQSIETLKTALAHTQTQFNDSTKTFRLLSLGQLGLTIHKSAPESQTLVYGILQQALKLAANADDKRLTAYARGYLGQLYEQSKRYQEAMSLTHQAIFLSQEMPDLQYRWEWQRGRILIAQNDIDGALEAYRRALEYLQPIRSGLSNGQRDVSSVFLERIRPVYFGLSDVLLRKAALTSDETEKQEFLSQAIDTVEKLKVAELQDYFQDECVTAKELTPVEVEKSHLKNTAVFYPVLLPERTELLLSVYEKIYQVSVPVDLETMQQAIVDFQQNLQIKTRRSYLRQSWKLYDWLIRPLESLLNQHEINTLVFIPDGALRMIPLGALHDKKQFLIDKYAIATTPSLDLTTPSPLPRNNLSILLNGLSESVQGFAALPNVPDEISNIRGLFRQSSVLMDEAFSITKVNDSLQEMPFVIIHIASHGQFSPNPKDTFLLTYDDKITMDRLERMLSFSEFRESTVELLTLSACQTAVGDERAALGLAGVAIKAGARSALASLWFVNDSATALLVTEFYKHMQDTSITKAEALRRSQAALAKQRDFRHPVFWAPFLLIGNWL